MTVACLWFPKDAPVQAIAESALEFSPQIALRRKEAVFIEIGKALKLYSEEDFLAKATKLLVEFGEVGRVRLAKNAPQAIALAKYNAAEGDLLPLDALKELCDPFDRDRLVQPAIEKIIEAFRDLGVRNLGAFRRLPVSSLITRFGPLGRLCWQRANGEDSFAWPRWAPAEVITEKSEFPYFEFYGELDPILFELKKQLDRIFARLWGRELRASKMRVVIYCEVTSRNGNGQRPFNFEFLFPQSATKGALAIIKERLMREFERRPVSAPIEALETTVLGTVPGRLGQKSLLERKEEIVEEQNALLGQLSEAHGTDRIFHAQLTEDRRPERSWKKTAAPPKTQPTIAGRLPKRPTYLIQPERLLLTAGHLKIRDKRYRILHWSPHRERIAGGWIEDINTGLENSYMRDYSLVQIEDGRTLAIFETDDGEFFLHGYFG